MAYSLDWKPKHNPWAIALTVTLATFMEVLDTSIANVALPHMAGSLGASQDEATWVLTSYLVSSAVILPISGWLSDRFGRKRFYLSCVVMFTVCSMLCGFAPTLPFLIVARVLQGLGGGGLAPSEQAILADTFPVEKRGQAFAVYGMAVVVAPAIGPTLGGWITDNFNWHWIFFINVPIGLFSFWLSSRMVEDPPALVARREAAKGTRVDFTGLALVASGVGVLEFFLDKGQEKDWFGDPYDPHRRHHRRRAARHLRLLGVEPPRPHRRSQAAQEPQLRHRGLSPAHPRHGALRLDRAHPAVPADAARLHRATRRRSPLARRLRHDVHDVRRRPPHRQDGPAPARLHRLHRHRARPLQPHPPLARHQLQPPSCEWRMLQVIGLPLVFIPISTLNYVGVPTTKMNQISSLSNFARNLGGSAGTALLTTFLARTAQTHQQQLAAHTGPGSIGYQRYIAAVSSAARSRRHERPRRPHQIAVAYAYQQMVRQASMLSYKNAFAVLATVILCLTPLPFIMRLPPKRQKPPPEAMEH